MVVLGMELNDAQQSAPQPALFLWWVSAFFGGLTSLCQPRGEVTQPCTFPRLLVWAMSCAVNANKVIDVANPGNRFQSFSH